MNYSDDVKFESSIKVILSNALRSKYFQIGLSLVISGISLYLATRHVDWAETWSAFAQAKWEWAFAAVLCVALNIYAKIRRWWLLSSSADVSVTFSKLTAAFLAGQMLNSIYPGRLGDLSRAYVTADRSDDRVFMLGTIVLEKVLDVISFALVAIGMTILVPLPRWINGSVASLALSGLVMVIVLWAGIRLRGGIATKANWIHRLINWLSTTKLGKKLLDWTKMGSMSLDVIGKRGVWSGVIGCTVIIWVTAFLNNWLVMQALNLGLNEQGEQIKASLVILVGLIAGITIPTPGRIGIFEYVCVLSLGLFNIPQAMALSYGLLLHTVVYIPPTLGGLVSILALGASQKR